jgi:hypothetical protein
VTTATAESSITSTTKLTVRECASKSFHESFDECEIDSVVHRLLDRNLNTEAKAGCKIPTLVCSMSSHSFGERLFPLPT